ncbi:MiaB/RimO family radical SAM methylthiotransferase [Falsiroseomonas sp. CW058]|uniref:MiaB/RimO family radical SAM methylthiotransferase n=1 Tax=Falsiroseomonas sp. CW058 TaxID=3388664 RepID=UPI003D323A21
MTAEAISFGCRLNATEAEGMRALAGTRDVLVVNTCAVTAEAEAQARQAIRRAVREKPGRPILVTGCAAEIAPAAWASLPGVARVIPNAAKLDPASWGGGAAPAPAAARTRAFLAVQNGCDHRCTFCVIPQGRGPSRSVPMGLVAERARALVEAGCREVVLTGVDIASYGADLPGAPRLGQMARRLLAAVPGLARLRLSSLDPVGMDEDLWRLVAEEPRLMPHLHLSVQHGADLVLKRMRRRHLRADVLALCRRARALRPEMAFGADLIAGFPTETEDHLAQLLDLVEACDLSFLHVFPYSERPGTAAARMPALPVAVRRERAARLREAGRRAARRLYDGRLGRVESVLVERGGRGHTEQFVPVRLRGPGPGAGELAGMRAVGADDDGLIVERV